MDPGELQMVREVVRPKTPRGDGNWIALTGLALILVVVRPKTPRGDGNSTSISLTSPGEKITSSDPKPRERTETRRRSRRCRCPNRRVVRPKTPRGEPPRHVRRLQFLERMGSCQVVHRGGTLLRSTPETSRRLRSQIRESPDSPGRFKGTETWSVSPQTARLRQVVRPKTPRGDGNLERVTADGTIETSRQTQNPERGRKPNLTACWVRRARRESSDPKP